MFSGLARNPQFWVTHRLVDHKMLIDEHGVCGFACHRVTDIVEYQTDPVVYSGPDPMSVFYDHVMSESKIIGEILKNVLSVTIKVRESNCTLRNCKAHQTVHWQTCTITLSKTAQHNDWVIKVMQQNISTLYRSFQGRFLQVRWSNQQHQSTEGSQLATEIGLNPVWTVGNRL